ncbi:probable mitochondrial glutathione transporter SLC25A40 isoform X1 [Schistocerca cancellata]|uniref:probable mitochondrial glutathione transporter SLC25A40 isoform X1 n=1 Tax=Schistocerca cancellata TaxID=274614 RepID=UPI002117AE50|nr:probable mitochondrial glutathione transporter SLC25A40 isoform X1 [Schistocerca cancellata]
MPENATSSESFNQDDPRYRITMPQQMAASCTGALLTSLVVTPFDVVKTRLQTQQKRLLSNKCYLYCNGLMDHLCPCVSNANGSQIPIRMPTPSTHFSGTVDAFVKIVRTEGVTSLWSGLSPTLVLAVPLTVIYFTSYEQLRLLIRDRHGGVQPVWGPLVAGAVARTWSVSVVSPLELVRTKMQSRRLSYLEIGEALKTLYLTRGVMGFWRGLGSTLLRDVPFSALYWLNYEALKSKFGPPTPSVSFSFFAGAVAGSIAAIVTNPFDVVKTHQQIDVGEKEIYSGKRKPGGPWSVVANAMAGSLRHSKDPPKRGSSMAEVLRRIYSQHGMRGLFAGLAPRLVKVAPACAIMISSFEYGKSFFRRYNERRTPQRRMPQRHAGQYRTTVSAPAPGVRAGNGAMEAPAWQSRRSDE